MNNNTRIDNCWRDICTIHLLTKHYLLLAESLSIKSETFLQPMKEHRDAYDHIIRVYAAKLGLKEASNDQYVLSNMNKALGHEYRAFFDTADWLTIIIKEQIISKLEEIKKEDLYQLLQNSDLNYNDFKQTLIKLPSDITQIRERKDISNLSTDVVHSYKELLDKLIKYYEDLCMILP